MKSPYDGIMGTHFPAPIPVEDDQDYAPAEDDQDYVPAGGNEDHTAAEDEEESTATEDEEDHTIAADVELFALAQVDQEDHTLVEDDRQQRLRDFLRAMTASSYVFVIYLLGIGFWAGLSMIWPETFIIRTPEVAAACMFVWGVLALVMGIMFALWRQSIEPGP